MALDILVNIGSVNGLVLYKHQAIAWTNADVLTTGPLGLKWNWSKTQTLLS